MKKIFITGANGFIGNSLIGYLSQYNYQIYALIKPGQLPSFNLKKNIHILYGDITNKKALQKLIPQKCTIINLAANPYHKIYSYLVNVEGVLNLLEVSKRKNIEQFIQLSSQTTKFSKKGVYGNTKNLADQHIVNSGIKYTILKPSLVYGMGKRGVFAKLIKNIKKVRIIPIFSKSAQLNPIYIDDLNIYIKYILDDKSSINQTLDIGSTHFITYDQFYKMIAKELQIPIYLVTIPSILGILIAKILNFFKIQALQYDQVISSSQNTLCNPMPIISKYKHKPLPFPEGIKKTINPQKLNIAIVGMGKMGLVHTTILNTFKNVKISAFIEPNKNLWGTIQTLGINCPLYSSLDQAAKSHKLDAVFITTPTFTHFDLLNQALKNDLHVFIEKPLVLNFKELHRLKSIKTKKVIHIGYNMLYLKTLNYVKNMLNQESLGSIVSYSAIFNHSEVLSPKTGWMFTKNKSGGGVLNNPGPHLVSMIYHLFGKPKSMNVKLKKIHSREVEDLAILSFLHKNYAGQIQLNWSARNQLRPHYEIKVITKKCKINITPFKVQIKQGRKNLKINASKIPSQTQSIFDINPLSFGETYYLEDLRFIHQISSPSKDNSPNSLKNTLQIESIIHKSYQSAIYV